MTMIDYRKTGNHPWLHREFEASLGDPPQKAVCSCCVCCSLWASSFLFAFVITLMFGIAGGESTEQDEFWDWHCQQH